MNPFKTQSQINSNSTTHPLKQNNPSKRRKYICLENIISNKYFLRHPGPPTEPLPKNSFDYFVERGTRFTGNRTPKNLFAHYAERARRFSEEQITSDTTYDFPARCVYNELCMSHPEYRDFTLTYKLRDHDHSEHLVRLIVPAIRRKRNCAFDYEFEHHHTKLSVAEDYVFRVFFLHAALMKTADSLMDSEKKIPFEDRTTYGYPRPDYEYATYENYIHSEPKVTGNPCNPYLIQEPYEEPEYRPYEPIPDPDWSLQFQSGLTGMVGESKESPTTTQDSQLVSVQDVDVVQSYPENEPDHVTSEAVFTDLNLAGVEWWLTRYTWTPSSTITTFDLYEMLFNAVNANSAIMKSFQVHALSHLKARIIVKPTANKFNVGLMGVTFVPLWNMWTIDDQTLWKNKYSLSQLPHKIINACSNNEVQLNVAFSYPLEYMPHIDTPNYLPSRTLGSLILFPFSPLSIGDQGTRTCDLNFFIHFENVEFVGKIDQRINMQSGMFGIVAKGIHMASALALGNPDPLFKILNGVARKLINNQNADHPINPSPGHFVIPQFIPSQSSVTNIENPVNSFRLDPMGVVTHNYPPVESFEQVVKTPGLFRQITIQSTDPPQLLTHWVNAPIKPYEHYTRSEIDSNRRHVPPLGIVSSFFENYKGSIVYDIIAAMTDKHNIKLMFGVFPTPISPERDVDITFLRNSKFVEINLCDGNFAASVTAPYFNPKVWTRTPANTSINTDCSSAFYPPSHCYLFAISTLSYSVGVSSSIQLNIFERAGEDFELSVYKSPCISVAPYTAPITYPRLTLHGLHWASDLTFTTSSEAPLGLPAGADFIWNMWFNNPTPYRAFLVSFGKEGQLAQPIPNYFGRTFAIAYVPLGFSDTSIVLISVLESIMNPLQPVYDAIAAFNARYEQTTFDALAQFLTRSPNDVSFHYGDNDQFFHVRWTPNQRSVTKQSGLTGNISNVPSRASPFQATTSRAWGVKDFKENFSSITNLMKRPYGDVNVNIDTLRSANFPNAAMRVNVSPAIPLLDPLPINSIEYNAAASAAEIVLKGFLGFKGSIILHALFPFTPNANVWTNYFPDAYPQRDISQYPTAFTNQRLISTAPKQTFNLGINSAVRTAVPYYSPSQFVLTWTTPTLKSGDNAVISSLGSVVYGLDVNQTSNIPQTMRTLVMRSFGDDAALYLFRGFPPVVFLAEHPPTARARDSTVADIEENPGPSFSTFVHNTARTAGHGIASGVFAGTEDYFSELSSTLENTIKHKLAAMGISSTPDFSISNILTVVIQESGHCLLSPTWKTFLWSFAIVLNKLGLIGINVIPKITSTLASWFTSVATTLNEPTTGAVAMQGPEEENLPVGFITILITGISTLFGIKEWKDDKNRTAKKFTDTFKSSLQLGTTLTAFLKATGKAFKCLFQTAYYWLIKDNKDARTVLALTVTDSLISNWMKEVDFLTDRSRREQITSDPAIQLRVRVAYIIGRRLHTQLILGNNRKTSPLTYYFQQIKKLYEEFAENGFSHHIRKEPFVIYVYGKTCIGKSQMQSDLCSKLLASENIAFDGPMVYTVPTISPFMSGLKKQPVIAVDDMMSVVIPESLRNWFTLVFENATCATFRPNMAAIEEKEKLVENEILYFNSNHEIINHDAIPDKNAFHRRFHFKIHAEIKPELASAHPTAKTIDREILNRFGHLRFRRTLNPHDVENPIYSPWMDYDQLIEHAIADFKAFRISAQESVNRRMLCELQSKSLGLSDISYDQLQDESFVEKKILEFLEELDTLENQRGIFSYDFRKAIKPATQTLCEVFQKYYPKVSSPVTNALARFKSWSFDAIKPETIVTQGPEPSIPNNDPALPTICISACTTLVDLYATIDPKYKGRVQQYVRTYDISNPVLPFLRGVRMYEFLNSCEVTKCRCEIEYLDGDEICELKEQCYVSVHKRVLKGFISHESKAKSWVQLVKDYVKKITLSIWDNMSLTLKCVLAICGAFFARGLIHLAFNWLVSKWNKSDNEIDKDFKETFGLQGHYSPGTSSKDVKKPSNVKTNVSSFTSKHVALQSGYFYDVVRKVRSNLRWITVRQPHQTLDEPCKMFPILGLRNREYFVILHLIKEITHDLEQGCIATFFDGQMNIPLSLTDFHPSLFKWRYTDTSLSELGLWNAPAKIHLISNITHMCGSRAKLNHMNNECFIIPGVHDFNVPAVLTRFNSSDARFYDDISEYNNLICYDDYSAPGFCGSLVFSKNLNSLVAIHVMGSTNGKLGFAELVFREDLENVVAIEPGFNSVELEPISQEEISSFPQYLKMLGKVPDHQVKKQATSSVFSLSPLANTVFEVRKEPAPLTSSDPRVNHMWSPMREGVKKHSNPPLGFHPQLLHLASLHSRELLIQSCTPVRTSIGILSIEDAVLGISVLNFKALDMSTSPGYPLNSIRSVTQKGKAFLFNIETINNERRLIGLHPDLKHILSAEEHMRKNATACFSPAIDCLKDELLKSEKAHRVGGTRVFSVSPVQQVIAGKRLMGDWLMAFRSNWFKLEHGISINPQSSDWMRLAQSLRKFPNILEGDFSNFGPQADSGVALCAIENIISWYSFHNATSEHLAQLHALKEELVNGIHICNNYVYSTISGIISGSFATAEINSEINKIYMRIAWLATTSTDLQTFSHNVVLFTYGDDVIMSVSDAYIEKFNVRTISEFLAQHGIKFTNASKVLEIIETVSLKEATFLKRGFRFDSSVPNQCLAPLDKVSIEEQINWVRNTQDPWDLIVASVNSMMIEAAMWGQSYYDNLKELLIRAFSLKEKYYPFIDYFSMINKIYYQDTWVPDAV